MCGIVGVLGSHEAAPILVDALKRLEYRGYDSAGIATAHNGALSRRRAVGKLAELSDVLVHDPLIGKAGIGHTRWATHGEPSVKNAHPHQKEQVAVVHNGIIENFRELREELANHDLHPETDTDTETVAMLTHHRLTNGMTPIDAARETVSKLEGAFALCFLFQGEEDLLIVARKGSPLAIGYGDNEMFVGSDAIALAPMTNRITYLDEGDFAVLTRNSVQIWDAQGAIKHYLGTDGHNVTLPGEGLDFTQFDRITMVACGTAYLACFTAKYWFEQVARIPVEVDIASEFRYREPPISDRTLAIFVSQSGETADTLAALRYCQGKAAKILSIVNVDESSIARESDLALPILAGAEIGVASTKAFTCQLTLLLSLAIKAATERGTKSEAECELIVHHMRSLPALINRALDQKDQFERAAHKLAQARDILFLGRGAMYPLAHEGALKLKEISYIHAEAYASGELKHGPLALIDDQVPVVVLAPKDSLYDKSISNVQEVMARKGRVLLLSNGAGLQDAGDDIWIGIEIPDIHEVVAPILYAVPAQLLAYYTALAKGTDVDQPRNLAKSVTVE